MEKAKVYAPSVVRIGIALVFLWFGISQVTDPSVWTALIPDYVKALPLSDMQLVLGNGIFEIIFGTLLLIGLWTRISALLLSIHLLHILTVVGYNAIGVRDFGLLLACVSIFLYGADPFSVDGKRANL